MCDLVLKKKSCFFVIWKKTLIFWKAKVWPKFFMKYTNNHIACYDYFFERIDNLFSEEKNFNTIKKYED